MMGVPEHQVQDDSSGFDDAGDDNTIYKAPNFN
jgi:hypothetical protein